MTTTCNEPNDLMLQCTHYTVTFPNLTTEAHKRDRDV